MRDPTGLDNGTGAGVEAMLRLAFLALLYDYVDFAHDIVERPAVKAWLKQRNHDGDMPAALGVASRFLARRDTRRRFKSWRTGLVKRVTSDIRHALIG